MLEPASMNCSTEEVLHHLRLLGYENIAEQQLKEFIRDLKKLIKHDQKKRPKRGTSVAAEVDKEFNRSILSSTSSASSTYLTTADLTVSQNDSFDCVAETSSSDSYGFRSEYKGLPDYVSRKKSVLREMDANILPKVQNPKLSGERKTKSVIRSWRCNQTSYVAKTDPVALYHWYQQHWNKQKVPGEESHKQLRWSIREKMLGDDPRPRPTSRVSGCSSQNSRK